MSDRITISATLPIPAKKIYDAWLNSKSHTLMTGGKATASVKVGGKFTAWDGYITGKNLELIKDKRILQSWRTTDFKPGDLDSLLLIKLEETDGRTKLTLIHSEIPKGQASAYKKGWRDFYFKPMKSYFNTKNK